jgi:hypothetical protein
MAKVDSVALRPNASQREAAHHAARVQGFGSDENGLAAEESKALSCT